MSMTESDSRYWLTDIMQKNAACFKMFNNISKFLPLHALAM